MSIALMKKPYRFDFQKLSLIYSKHDSIQSAVASKERLDRALSSSITRKESDIKKLREEYDDLRKSVKKLRSELLDLEERSRVKGQRLKTLRSGIEKAKEEVREMDLSKEDLKRNITSKISELHDLEKRIRNEQESLSTLAYQYGELNKTIADLETLVRDFNDSTSELETRRESLLKSVNELDLALRNTGELERQLLVIEGKIKSSSILSTLSTILEKPDTVTYDKEVLLKPFSQILKGVKVYVANNYRRFNSPRSLGESIDKAIDWTEKELI